MSKLLLSLSLIFAASSAFAVETTYKVTGMHCGSCAEAIKAQVCKLDGLEKCDVTMGKVVISPKTGITFTKAQIQDAVSKAGEYKIVSEKTSK